MPAVTVRILTTALCVALAIALAEVPTTAGEGDDPQFVVHLVAASEALDHGDVEPAIRLALSTSDLTDLLGLEVQKQRELGDPLLE